MSLVIKSISSGMSTIASTYTSAAKEAFSGTLNMPIDTGASVSF